MRLSWHMDLPQDMLGPKMLALRTDAQRKFAFFMGCGELVPTEAARQAGYADDDTSLIRVTAHRLMHTPEVLDAIRECARKVLDSLAPVAVRCARSILDDKKHPHHGRMIETILNRTGFGEKTEHKVTVEHTVDTKELEALARRLAAENGLDARKLLGRDAGTNAKVIEHEPEGQVGIQDHQAGQGSG